MASPSLVLPLKEGREEGSVTGQAVHSSGVYRRHDVHPADGPRQARLPRQVSHGLVVERLEIVNPHGQVVLACEHLLRVEWRAVVAGLNTNRHAVH